MAKDNEEKLEGIVESVKFTMVKIRISDPPSFRLSVLIRSDTGKMYPTFIKRTGYDRCAFDDDSAKKPEVEVLRQLYETLKKGQRVKTRVQIADSSPDLPLYSVVDMYQILDSKKDNVRQEVQND